MTDLDLVARLHELGAERAGGSTGEANYDPELLSVMYDAADTIERLVAELASRAEECAKVAGTSYGGAASAAAIRARFVHSPKP